MNKTYANVIELIGPSAVGKTTLRKELERRESSIDGIVTSL